MAHLRAFRYFASFRGGDSRTWLLAIVRNVYNTWVQRKSSRASEGLSDEAIEDIASPLPSPEAKLLQTDDRQRLRQALELLPLEYREVIVLRELEELSYREIADIVGVPLGTVMSRLARARKRLQQCLMTDQNKGQAHEV